MHRRLVAVSKNTSRLNDKIDSKSTPWQRLRVTLCQDLQYFSINTDAAFNGVDRGQQVNREADRGRSYSGGRGGRR